MHLSVEDDPGVHPDGYVFTLKWRRTERSGEKRFDLCISFGFEKGPELKPLEGRILLPRVSRCAVFGDSV